MGVPIKSSVVGERLCGKGLQRYFKDSQRQADKGNLMYFPEKIIAGIFEKARNFTQFRDWLGKAGIEIIPTHNKNGGVQGLSYLHRPTGLILNGSGIGFAAKRVFDKFPLNLEPETRTEKLLTEQAGEVSGIGNFIRPSEIADLFAELFSIFEAVNYPEEYIAPEFRLHYRRKKKKNRLRR